MRYHSPDIDLYIPGFHPIVFFRVYRAARRALRFAYLQQMTTEEVQALFEATARKLGFGDSPVVFKKELP